MVKKNKARILIIDDEPSICELIREGLAVLNVKSDAVGTLAAARQLLVAEKFDFCLCDIRLPDGNGLSLVKEIASNYPDLPVAIITAYSSSETAIEALKFGAFDYLTKPVSLSRLRALVRIALGEINTKLDKSLIGQSAAMQRINQQIDQVAHSNAPVVIVGESGSGKELAARAIHDRSRRATAPFVAVNCGAIPEGLMEAEFFGYRKGAFTGASQDSMGFFRSANDGTLFLDEIAAMPFAMQVKLLRAVQEKAIRPLGVNEECDVNCRIICATHGDLQTMVSEGTFRHDLYYRLNVIQLPMPALRERRDDIPLLAQHIMQRIDPDLTKQLTPAALTKLQNYHFSGNVRELENIIERAYTLSTEKVINAEDVYLINSQEPFLTKDSEIADLDHYLAEIEREAICTALQKCQFSRTKAAEMLGISVRSIRYRIERLAIDMP